jgi:large subunit ribosomal protein L29
MKLEELRKKTKEEMHKILQDDREKLRQLRFDLAAGKVKNVREIRKIKKEVAQTLTLLSDEDKSLSSPSSRSARLGK